MNHSLKYLIILSFLFSGKAYAQQATLKQKAVLLTKFMDKWHYQPLAWNDSSSERLYNKWLSYLDHEKLLFTREDIAALEPFRTRLDDELKGPGWEFFNASVRLYRQRVSKTDTMVKIILSKPLDFSVSEYIDIPFNGFAANDAELELRWKKYAKWQVLRKIADDNDSTNVTADIFNAAEKKAVAEQKIVGTRYFKRLLRDDPSDFDEAMQDAYLNAIAWCYDPHSSYMNAGNKAEHETEGSAAEYSVGFEVDENDKGEAVISFLQPGGSAWKNGQLHKGDILLAIKTGLVFTNITELSEDEVEDALGGTGKATVEIKVRTLTGETKTVRLEKEKISSEENVVKSYVLKSSSNIGYINLPGFYSRESGVDDGTPNYNGAANDVSKEIVKLKKDSIAGLILDLRYNGGGSVWEAIQLAGIFIDVGPVASMKDREGKVRFLKDPNRGTIYDGPLMVLINGASASASEFIAAVLQDYNRALVVGGITYGKGTSQVVLPMDTVLSLYKKYEHFVKVTHEKFYRVNGSTTQWKGVVPDILIPDIYSNSSYKEKSSISALQPDLSKAAVYKPSVPLPVQELNNRSRARIELNNYFKSVNSYITLISQYEKGRQLPLTWSAYLSQYRIAKALFKALSQEGVPADERIPVQNNSFDYERFDLSSGNSREVNETYLKMVSRDAVVKEAMLIMLDWTGKK